MKYILIFLFCINVYADNSVTIDQTGINDRVTIDQIGDGQSANIILNGDNKTVNLIQEGTTPQSAAINLYGTAPVSVSISQINLGVTASLIDVTSSCTAPSSCGTITIQSVNIR